MESNSLTVKSIEKVLGFLVKTLRNIRPEGFNVEEGFGVGKQIFELVRAVVDEFDFDGIILKLEGLPDLLNCLMPKFSRNCCLTIILPKLNLSVSEGNISSDGLIMGEPENDPPMISSSPFSLIVKLFGCITQRDLVQLIDGKEEEISSVTNDLEEFSESILVDFPIEKIEEFYNSANSPSSCLNLFLIPKLLELSSDPLLCKKMISGFLCNTSTVMSSVPASETTSPPPFQWIRPEYPKLMAVKMYLQVIDRIELDYYEFYTEILTILNNNISQDQLKIEIIESVLSSLTRSRNKDKSFSIVDFRCLLDHLAMESGQLLRKSDRCKLLLKIFDNCGNGEIFRSTSTYSEKDCNERSTINPGYSFKYLDQVTGLLNQLSTNENELKFELACKLFEFIFETKGKLETFDEKKLYNWAIELIKSEPKKEIKFYAIKIKRDEQISATAADEDEDEIVEGDESTKIVTDKIVVDNVIEALTSDDLQKLKIFESFQM
ncbi:hypothetical protein C9890_0629 [Perkinsus sp. BL_2016]|nr:hypothetical protein C9890_0629 [Perkinsus sp. BL_2016]